ncbi:MAG: hypothetical protein A2428_08125 [Bdellovibrionales bacterium RIFOXYC1_FULL_54_43]|nr:MAG: hypothetical protein A2428_08125 [Bdellovibrionales bacterium RIFOXYC1_FULL_54_43]
MATLPTKPTDEIEYDPEPEQLMSQLLVLLTVAEFMLSEKFTVILDGTFERVPCAGENDEMFGAPESFV